MSINFDALPKENPYALPEAGVYHAHIAEAEMKQGKDIAKPPYLNLKYQLSDANGNNKGTLYDIISESDSSVVQYKIARFIRACGIPLTGSMELKDIAKVVAGRDIVVDVSIDNKQNPPRAQVDLFSRQAFYLPQEFEEVYALVNPPKGELNEFNSGNDEEIPFNATDGGAPINTPNTPVY